MASAAPEAAAAAEIEIDVNDTVTTVSPTKAERVKRSAVEMGAAEGAAAAASVPEPLSSCPAAGASEDLVPSPQKRVKLMHVVDGTDAAAPASTTAGTDTGLMVVDSTSPTSPDTAVPDASMTTTTSPDAADASAGKLAGAAMAAAADAVASTHAV